MQTNPFSTEAAEYAHLRPTYPEDLFAFLATLVPSRDVARGCAPGNGQAATHLAGYLERVTATDESGEMIAQAYILAATSVQAPISEHAIFGGWRRTSSRRKRVA